MADNSQKTCRIRPAVVTGGHSFDVVNFHQLFHSLDRDDFASWPEDVRDGYDVILITAVLGAPQSQLDAYPGLSRTPE